MMQNKTVLVLGTSFSALPFIQILNDLGYSVGTVGSDPDDVGHRFSDTQFYADYSNCDDVKDIFKRHPFSYVVPTCNDTAYLTAAQLKEDFSWLNNDNLKIAESFLHKQKFKKVCEDTAVLTPRTFHEPDHIDFDDVKEVVVKATDQSSGVGMARCRSHDELRKSIISARATSKEGKVVVEEYLDGPLFSFTTFNHKNKLYYTTSCNEFCNVTGFQVSSSSWPSSLEASQRNEIIQATSKIEGALNIQDGMTHYQLILHDSKPYFIEAMRRCPGDLFPRGVQLSEGIDFHKLYLSFFLGTNFGIQKSDAKHANIYREIYYPKDDIINKGIISDFNIREYYPLSAIGAPIKHAPIQKLGIAFSEELSKDDKITKSDWYQMSGYKQ